MITDAFVTPAMSWAQDTAARDSSSLQKPSESNEKCCQGLSGISWGQSTHTISAASKIILMFVLRRLTSDNVEDWHQVAGGKPQYEWQFTPFPIISDCHEHQDTPTCTDDEADRIDDQQGNSSRFCEPPPEGNDDRENQQLQQKSRSAGFSRPNADERCAQIPEQLWRGAKSAVYQCVQLEHGQEAVDEQKGVLLLLAILGSQVAGYLAVHPPAKLTIAGKDHAQVQGEQGQHNGAEYKR